MSAYQHVVRPRIAPPSLRPAPAALTPQVADRLAVLAERLCAIREDADREAREAGARRAIAAQFANVSNPLPTCPPPSPGFAAELAAKRLSDIRPIAADREPCGRCGTRGDLDCAHRRALGGGISSGALPVRALDGSYPFRSHPSVAEIWARKGSE